MRVMLLGAGGMLGRDLASSAPATAQVAALPRTELDVTDATALARAARELQPNVIINAAAYTLVDRAESEGDVARRVNGDAVGAIGRTAAAAGAVVVHFSTDYVFDGTSDRPYAESASPHPVSVYGASKLAGEDQLACSGASFLLVRTQWLFGVHGRSFPRTMWERVCRGQATRVVADQTGRPTYTLDLAHAVWRLLSRGARGILHVANSESATWYDVANRVFSRAGRADLLIACTTAEYPTSARRPAHSVLDTRNAEALLGEPLPSWVDGIDRFLDKLERT